MGGNVWPPRAHCTIDTAEFLMDAVEIEALAKRRLAHECDAAQERGEAATQSRHLGSVPGGNTAPADVTDLGLTRTQVHEARQIRNAEAVAPDVSAAPSTGG